MKKKEKTPPLGLSSLGTVRLLNPDILPDNDVSGRRQTRSAAGGVFGALARAISFIFNLIKGSFARDSGNSEALAENFPVDTEILHN